MEIDIRHRGENQKIDRVRFAENKDDDGCVLKWEGNFLYTIDQDGDDCDGIHIENIDNLILALKKVKELISINK